MTTLAPPITRPKQGEYAEYYAKYVNMVSEGDIVEILRLQGKELADFLRAVNEPQGNIVHPPYAWTIKQVVNHIIDGERIFAYRLLRIARGDKTPLPGFDENEYAKTAKVENVKLSDLAHEFDTVRAATLSLLRNLPSHAWTNTGTANDKSVSVRALAWIMAGHLQHHLAIMRKRLDKTT